jgi:cytochrome c oxidase cbb3-type subunit 4
MMSYETYGPYVVVVMLLTFIGLFIWVLSPRRTADFNEAANLPFADEGKGPNPDGDIKHD